MDNIRQEMDKVMSYPTAVSYGLIALTTVILGYYTLNDDGVDKNEEPTISEAKEEIAEEPSGGLFGGITEKEDEEKKEEEMKEEEPNKNLFENLPFKEDTAETSETKVGGKNMKTRRHKKKNKKTAKRRD